ncbi:MAG: YrdB family protein [Chloroflexi bacterium]|nr:YrdB family protein [Chloroflexota bacterium]
MGENPVNLALRFVLELAAIAALAVWGWSQHDGLLRVLLAIGLPLLGGTVGCVPGAGGRRRSVVAVSGAVRLLIELALFGAAVVLLYSAGETTLALMFAVVIVVHYTLSYDRVIRLLRGNAGDR